MAYHASLYHFIDILIDRFKHHFLCINICWTPMVVLKPELTTPRGLADDMLMLDRCYCIKSFCRLKVS